jgi:hypothetical protein
MIKEVIIVLTTVLLNLPNLKSLQSNLEVFPLRYFQQVIFLADYVTNHDNVTTTTLFDQV